MRLGDFNNLYAISGMRRLRVSNYGLRALALTLAIGLWIFVNAGERGSVEPLTVPITYSKLPAGMVIVNHPPDFVKIEVAGPRTILSLLDPGQLRLNINLKGAATGQSEYKIYPSMFNTKRGTSVTSISPEQLSIDLDRVVTREVPVHLAVQDRVEPGYQISGVDITPPTVTLEGPSRYVAPLTSISTEPFDLKGLNVDTERQLLLAAPNPTVGLSTARVNAKVNVAEAIEDREFRGVNVQVKDSGFKFRVEPRSATLTIRGPAVKLASLAPKGLAYVDANGLTPGFHEVPLQVVLPDGMQLVRQSPDRVRLRMYHEKLPTATADEHPS